MSKPLTEERLAEIEAREQAATKGPWFVNEATHPIDDNRDVAWLEIGPHEDDCCDSVAYSQHANDGNVPDDIEADFAFIAHARADVPDLVKALRHFTTLPPEVAAAMERLHKHELAMADSDPNESPYAFWDFKFCGWMYRSKDQADDESTIADYFTPLFTKKGA